MMRLKKYIFCYIAVILTAVIGSSCSAKQASSITLTKSLSTSNLSPSDLTSTAQSTATLQVTPTVFVTQSPIVVVVATSVPTPEPPLLKKYQQEIATAILGIISGVLLTLVIPATWKQIKKGATWLNRKLRIERQLFGDYCRNVSGDLRKIKILGMAKPRDLEQIFVPLKIQEFVSPDLLEISAEHNESSTTTISFNEALDRFPQFIVLGDPGAGKTTLVRHAAVLSAERKLYIKKKRYLPIYVPLYDLKTSFTTDNLMKKDFEEILTHVLKSYGFPDPKDFILKHLKNGSCLILLDGFDELADERLQETIAQKARNLVRSYHEENRIVLTSRVARFRGGLFSRFVTLEITNLPFDQAKLFVNRWFVETPTKAEKLIKILEENRRLHLIVNNPLMLAVVCITFDRREDLPHRKVDLYDRCIDTLIRVWDESRGITRQPEFDAETKWKVLSHVAFDFHSARKADFNERELLAAIRKHISKTKERPYRDQDFLEETLEHTGILRQKAQDTYTFQHLTFQEYLAALVLAQDVKRQIPFILAQLEDPWWREVIVLTAGILRDATELIEKIYQKVQNNPSDEMYLLMGRCLTDADLSNFDLKDEILARVVLIAVEEERVL